MNTFNENHELSNIGDPHDRLLEVALAELVGGHTPPDLSPRIAAANIRPAAVARQAPRTRERRAFWASLAVAVMLLISTTTVVVLQVKSVGDRTSVSLVREAAVANFDRLGNSVQNSHNTRKGVPVALPAETPAARSANSGAEPRVDDIAQVMQSTLHTSKDFTPEQKSLPHFTSNLDVPFTQNSFTQDKSAPQIVKQGAGQFTGGPVDTVDGTMSAPASAPQPHALFAYSPREKQLNQNARVAGHAAKEQQIDEHRWADPRTVAANEVPGFTSAPRSAETLAASNQLQSSLRENIAQDGYELSGRGPSRFQHSEDHDGPSRDRYSQIIENQFIKAEGSAAVSTFSIDVDTASYANVRQFLLDMNQLPPPDAVRIEELVNYFAYNYGPPISPDAPVPFNTAMATAYVEAKANDFPPFAAHVEITGCPWSPEHRLARIGIKGREMDRHKRPQSNLVFLIDVSGSMDEPAKLPLVIYGLEQLTRELGENDHVAIVVYASSEGLVLPSTSGSKQETILAALAKLKAGGSTAGGAGIHLAYQIAEENFIKGGTNRVILCTDGDFNVGVTNTDELQRMVEKKAKDAGVFISTLGFGRGNLNDAMMVSISDHGNGNYHYIDNRSEARRVLVEEMAGTLVTIAKDVKIQVEFNPAKVAGYRLIGYEKRMLKTEDFNDDKKDAGEIGAGHTVTALYEIVPAGKSLEPAPVDDLKYQKPVGQTILSVENKSDEQSKHRTDRIVRPTTDSAAISKELLTLKMRYKAPDGDTSKKLEWAITDDGKTYFAASADTKFAAAVAGFGLLLRDSKYKGNLTFDAVLELAQSGIGEDPHGYRKEFLDMVRRAKELQHK